VWSDLTTGDSRTADLPPGLSSFADVAGGRTITAPDGTSYLVGATRMSGDPTSAVLRIDPYGSMDVLDLTAPRLGAAAAFAPALGLVLVGGSTDAFGIEMLGAGSSAFVSLAYPADPVQGAALVALTPDLAPPPASGMARPGTNPTMVLVGGRDVKTNAPAPTRLIDPSCGASCAPVMAGMLAGPFDQAEGFSIDDGALFVGTAESGETKALHLTAGGVMAAAPFRIPRKGATPVALANGAVAVAGGLAVADAAPALAVETFLP
jgi:hypothetical protein